MASISMTSSSVSDFIFSDWRIVAAGLVLFAFSALFGIYRAALPKWYPEIPHHQESQGRIFGDLSRLINHAKGSGGQVLDWMGYQTVEIGSPIVQLAMKPFSPPYIVLDDYATAEDILNRRLKEFDKGKAVVEFFQLLITKGSLVMLTDDTYKFQRRAWQGTMSAPFLHSVAAPYLHHTFTKLIELWTLKSKLAGHHPFDAAHDIPLATLDAIFSVAYGEKLGAVDSQLGILADRPSVDLTQDRNEPVIFAEGALPPLAWAIETLVNTISPHAPLTTLRNLYLSLTPKVRKAKQLKDTFVESKIREFREKGIRKKHADSGAENATCAMDHVIEKEIATHEKGGAILNDAAMKDEAFSFLLGGHETTATTLQWVVKVLADHPRVQTQLHNNLMNSLPDGFSATDIIHAKLPYLDAVVHEMLRWSRTTGVVVREAMCDTQILGYPVPRGAQIMISLQGDSYMLDDTTTRPPIPKGQQANYVPLEREWQLKGRRGFDPSRWLTNVDGAELFDQNAGPSLPFSSGLRSCFGKRLALLELRIAIALLVRYLRFEPVPEALNSYGAFEIITRIPRQCYIRPSRIA